MEVIVMSKAETDKARKVAMEKVWPKLIRDEYSKRYVEAVKQLMKDEGMLQ